VLNLWKISFCQKFLKRIRTTYGENSFTSPKLSLVAHCILGDGFTKFYKDLHFWTCLTISLYIFIKVINKREKKIWLMQRIQITSYLRNYHKRKGRIWFKSVGECTCTAMLILDRVYLNDLSKSKIIAVMQMCGYQAIKSNN